MRLTAVLRQQADEKKRRSFKSLALSVYFKQPDFNMKDYEILSRASAFLLGVDPPDWMDKIADINDSKSNKSTINKQNPFAHLEAAEQRRRIRDYMRQHNGYSPPGGPPGGRLMDMGWLEFVPKEVRPQVHVVASSHVLSPFLWKDYYPHDWLRHVRQEHCKYTLEVYEHDDDDDDETDTTTMDHAATTMKKRRPLTLDQAAKTKSLAKLALNSIPFHHPEGRDVGVIHFDGQEASSLKILKNLGVKVLHLRDPDKLYEKGEVIFYDGYVVTDVDMSSSSDNVSCSSADDSDEDSDEDDGNKEEDVCVFQEYKDQGHLTFHTNDRFFATSSKGTLPEGVCGAPVLDKHDNVCGVVEGYVPLHHKDERLAGAAAFLPSYSIAEFVDVVERRMLQQIMPPDLFQMVVTAKKTNSIGGGVFKAPKGGGSSDGNDAHDASDWDEAYELILKNLKKRHSKEEVDAILQVVQDESEQVMDIMNKEGGDLDEIIARVRDKTLKIREMVHDEYRKSQQQQEGKEPNVVNGQELADEGKKS
jgi:hypothetical protein